MKLLSSTIKLVMIAIVVSIISMMTTFAMVNIYADKLLQQFDLGFQDANVSLNELMSEITGQPSTESQPKITITDTDDNKETVEEAETESVEVWSQQIETGAAEAVEVWNQQAESQLEQEQQMEQLLISMEDFNRLKDQLSDEDKMKVFSLAISNIPPQQIHAFSHILENGITEQELQDLDEMLRQYLDTDDYLMLMSIISKYEE